MSTQDPRDRRTTRDEADFAREIDAHLALEADQLVAEGVDPEAARIAARRRFGSVLAARERFYESRRARWWDQAVQDVRYGARAMARYPIAAAVAVLSLAVGIGATTASLTIRDAIFRKPPPLYRDPAMLSRIQAGTPARPIRPATAVPGALFAHWHEAGLRTPLAAAAPTRVREFRTDDRVDTIRVRAATANLFSVVGVDAAVGSATLTPGTVVLSDRLWQNIFDRRSDIVGRTLWIDDRPYSVSGVMPKRFWFATTDSAAWVLLPPDAIANENTVEVIARRESGVTPAMLGAELERGVTSYVATLPAGERDVRVVVAGIEGTPVSRAVTVALPWLLAAAVALTLLLACANVAILVIAQWTAREHEIAIRASLGASRGRIVASLLAESAIIAATGGSLGVLVTTGFIRFIARNGDDAGLFDLTVERHVFVAALAVSALAALVSGLGPALLATQRLHANPMRTLTTADRVRQRWRHGLVIGEIAVTVALLVVMGTMLGAYRRQISRDLGFNPHPLLAVRVENGRGVAIRHLVDVVSAMPGVAVASAATSVPYMGFGPLETVALDAAGSRTVRAERVAVGPAFFDTLGVPIRAGRAFTAADSAAARRVIINESLAGRLFAGVNPIGREIWMGAVSYEVAGVAAQYVNIALQGTDWDPKIYTPLAVDSQAKQITMIVRASDAPSALARPLRNAARDADAGNVVAGLFTLDQVIAISGQEMLVGTAPLAPLSGTGLLLTTAGIYGVLAFAIARRSKELALRIAIGASASAIVRLVAGHAVRLIVLGTMIGIGLTFALSRVLRASGGGGSFLDPDWTAFAVPVVVIALVGFAAAAAPSYRARRIDPAVLLRST